MIMLQTCNNCLFYNKNCQWRQCEIGYGNVYPQDHGCYQWKENKEINNNINI